ncbi:hypothetical protein AZE42_04260 [Rhizopogon vesiculosus]|uniref:Cytochrome P450 n=1 Tax=Rhizopogon vesiculosus TaxID=180088 RepID=A0A1J8PQH0_9AGAM|nr:hypothetical protein AZE42_04260 [Rhizopogon vesiculosus]
MQIINLPCSIWEELATASVVVIANTWAMTHNEQKYPNPNEFKPERFLHEYGSLTSDTMPLGFGWDRRMCVGRHLADAALWMAITSFLATFLVQKTLDAHGEEIPVVPKFSTSLIMTIFSGGCVTISLRRASLQPNTIRRLILVNQWLPVRLARTAVTKVLGD